jgi:hypothetical protein
MIMTNQEEYIESLLTNNYTSNSDHMNNVRY